MPEQVFFRNSLETLYPAFTPALVEYLLDARTINFSLAQYWADRFHHDLFWRGAVFALVPDRASVGRATNARALSSQLGESAHLQSDSNQFEATVTGLFDETLAGSERLKAV